jgi:hypothetical protein
VVAAAVAAVEAAVVAPAVLVGKVDREHLGAVQADREAVKDSFQDLALVKARATSVKVEEHWLCRLPEAISPVELSLLAVVPTSIHLPDCRETAVCRA